MAGPPRLIRDFEPDDINLVKHSWKKSYRDPRDGGVVNTLVGWVSTSTYYSQMGMLMDKLIDGGRVRLQVNSERPQQIYGWACADGDLLHFVYVKQPFRRYGLARELLADLGFTGKVRCSHWTRYASAYAAKKPSALIFDPYSIEAAVPQVPKPKPQEISP